LSDSTDGDAIPAPEGPANLIETDYEIGQNNVQLLGLDIHNPVFAVSGLSVVAFVIITMAFQNTIGPVFTGMRDFLTSTFDWFFLLAGNIFVLVCLGLIISPLGKVRIGGRDATPDYGYAGWFAMLFAAGMGIGLMFYGVSEPISHYSTSFGGVTLENGVRTDWAPLGGAEGDAAASHALGMAATIFHWGLHPWAIYAIVALSLALFAYNKGLPLTVRSIFYPIFGERIWGWPGHIIDILAVFATLFGLATSLGVGAQQANAGLNYLFGLPIGTTSQIVLIALITGVALISVLRGLDGGVKLLSEVNLVMAGVLVVFILLAGPTLTLFGDLVDNVGAYAAELIPLSNPFGREDANFSQGWTAFYWAWWISWSPFVGMFIARISRGRTVREFVIGVLLVPLGFTFLWMTVHGNSALHLIMVDGARDLMTAVQSDSSVALYRFLEQFPLTALTSTVATCLVVLFFVTSADSGALVIDMLSSKGEEEAPIWQRLFWSVLVGLVAIALLAAGGLTTLQAATIAAALPFTVVMLVMCWGLLKAMRMEVIKRQAMSEARTAIAGSDWRDRLRALIHQPDVDEVQQFLGRSVAPALREVADELRGHGLHARVDKGVDGRVWIEVGHGEEMDFFYSVRPRPFQAPTFVLEDPRRAVDEDDRTYRAEVYLREGGQGYDIMGWRKAELIHDVLDQYHRHLHFLDAVR